ncbi:hypothetical protein [Streptomyces cinereospinus]|uniref:Uncharacterized protein n=1 Tax=Streptomyces cinereospinus TaxID=285561 RepID=A0ABV5MXK8_9ACTN
MHLLVAPECPADSETATVVDYIPARDEDAPLAQRETYRVLEDTHRLG